MIETYESISKVSKKRWDELNTSKNPFTSYEFFKALESSQVVTSSRGWIPRYYLSKNSAAYIFIKNHSYGEYIFDWTWANAYEAHGINYYPKLTSMAPFSPVSVKHFLGEYDPAIADEIYRLSKQINSSSSHFLYVDESEKKYFKDNYILRESIQYHFFNKQYSDYENFLKTFKSKKRKQIVKERSFSEDIKIKRYTENNLSIEHAHNMFLLYQKTTYEKGSIQYLNLNFFVELFKNMPNNVLYIEAYDKNEPIAASLFLYDHEKLYGRYWGCSREIKNLHFELCLYQGIEFCIEKNLKTFEAGAQGEHKIKRGFEPTIINSAHKIENQAFSEAIENYVQREKEAVREQIIYLKEHLPFKSDQES